MNTNAIIKLIQRDFRVYARPILQWSFFGLVAGMFFIFVNTNLVRMFTGSANFIFIASIWPFVLELKNNSTWVHTSSLPVSRREVVTARYLVSLMIGAVNLAIWVGAFFVLHNLLNADPQYMLNSKAVLYVWMDLLFSFGLIYFAYYRFTLAIGLVFYLVMTLVPQLLRSFLGTDVIPLSDTVIANFSLFSTGAIVAMVVFALSYVSSLQYFPKREL